MSNRTGSSRKLQQKEPPGFQLKCRTQRHQRSLSPCPPTNSVRDNTYLFSRETLTEQMHLTNGEPRFRKSSRTSTPSGVENVSDVLPDATWPTSIEPIRVVPTPTVSETSPPTQCILDMPTLNCHPLSGSISSTVQSSTAPSVVPQTMVKLPMNASIKSYDISTQDLVRSVSHNPLLPHARSPPLFGATSYDYHTLRQKVSVMSPCNDGSSEKQQGSCYALPVDELSGKTEDQIVQWTFRHLQDQPDLLKQFIQGWMDDTGRDVFVEKLMGISVPNPTAIGPIPLPLPYEYTQSDLYD